MDGRALYELYRQGMALEGCKMAEFTWEVLEAYERRVWNRLANQWDMAANEPRPLTTKIDDETTRREHLKDCVQRGLISQMIYEAEILRPGSTGFDQDRDDVGTQQHPFDSSGGAIRMDELLDKHEQGS